MKILIVAMILVAFLPLNAQNSLDKLSGRLKAEMEYNSDSEELLIWVYLRDKGNDIQRYIETPELVVSSKSLNRRSKVLSESALIDYTDIPVLHNYVDQLSAAGLEIRNRSKWFNAVSGFISEQNINMISTFDFVTRIDLVGTFAKRVDDPEMILDNSVHNNGLQPDGMNIIDYGASFTQLNLIRVPEVHNLGYNGSGVTICVMDAGFGNLTHEAFQSMNIIAKYDFVNGSPVMGSHSHGTAVLSILGGYKEGELVGPAYGAEFILARTEDAGSETPVEEDNWVAALEWADSIGVDITSTSLGYLDYDPPFTSYTWLDMDGNTAIITIAGDLAVARGILVVNSAGNNGYHSTRNTLGAPADGDSIISVGSVNSSGARSSFSSVGPTVDGRIKPDVMAMGSGVYYASLFGNNYSSGSGTSFSCPLVSGVSALLLSANPNLTPMEIREIFRSTSSNSSSPDREYGWGIVDAVSALNLVPVPVELVSMHGSYEDGVVNLEWVTSTENNNFGFEIERRSDFSTFKKIGFIPSTGNSVNALTYNFIDRDIRNSRYFYRLKQIDLDGSFEYSEEIMVEISELNDFILHQNYPNPFNPSTTLRFTVPYRVNVKITLNDILGREIKVLFEAEAEAGSREVIIDGSSLASGNYFIKMTAGIVQKIQKITLLK